MKLDPDTHVGHYAALLDLVLGDGSRLGLLNHGGAHGFRGTPDINSLAGKKPELMEEVKRDKLHQHNIFLCLWEAAFHRGLLLRLPSQALWVRGAGEGLGTLAGSRLSVIVLESSLQWLQAAV